MTLESYRDSEEVWLQPHFSPQPFLCSGSGGFVWAQQHRQGLNNAYALFQHWSSQAHPSRSVLIKPVAISGLQSEALTSWRWKWFWVGRTAFCNKEKGKATVVAVFLIVFTLAYKAWVWTQVLFHPPPRVSSHTALLDPEHSALCVTNGGIRRRAVMRNYLYYNKYDRGHANMQNRRHKSLKWGQTAFQVIRIALPDHFLKSIHNKNDNSKKITNELAITLRLFYGKWCSLTF